MNICLDICRHRRRIVVVIILHWQTDHLQHRTAQTQQSGGYADVRKEPRVQTPHRLVNVERKTPASLPVLSYEQDSDGFRCRDEWS